MFASFHSKGTIPSCSDMLNTCASGLLICSTVSFSILGDNPSTPGDNGVGDNATIFVISGFESRLRPFVWTLYPFAVSGFSTKLRFRF